MDRASDYGSVASLARFSHMISYLKGVLIEKTANTATVLVNDAIGYDVCMNPAELTVLASQTPIALYCYHHITDRSQELYGFLTHETKTIFILLIEKVSGIGPKSALKIVSKAGAEQMKTLIAKGDSSSLASLGIGKKTAEKIIAALKEKINYSGVTGESATRSIAFEEALNALISLGYSKSEGEKALQQIEIGTKKTEILVKEALRLL